MAHPGYIALDSQELEQLFRRMAGLGLAGIEVFYPTHSPEMVDLLLAFAEKMGLLVTGGTDFHGREGEAAPLGGVPGEFTVETGMIAEFFDICTKSRMEVVNGEAERAYR